MSICIWPLRFLNDTCAIYHDGVDHAAQFGRKVSVIERAMDGTQSLDYASDLERMANEVHLLPVLDVLGQAGYGSHAKVLGGVEGGIAHA